MDQAYRTRYLKLRSVLYDRVTGLPAFPVLFDRLRSTLGERRQLGVVHLEVGNLETVESLYGWQVFDRIVARVSGLLSGALGRELPADAMLAVNGVAGDRFVVFVPGPAETVGADTEGLERMGSAICDRLRREFEDEVFAGLNPTLEFRWGQAVLSVNPFYRFERCVYAAVEEARGFHERREQRRAVSWTEEIQRIIRDTAVDAVLQPIVSLSDGSVVGHEAFVRGPSGTVCESPRAMLELSNRVGIGAELDQICFETAVRAAASLEPRGKIFVNVLPESLDDDAWRRQRLPALLSSLELTPGDLVLELSERHAGLDPDPLAGTLEGYKKDGFAVALDDVGTGRYDLRAIERLGPDYVKLDLSLVRDIHENLIRQELLSTLVRLAGRIDATVVAEGVESEQEAAFLRQSGAGLAQGYLFGRPAPPEAGGGKKRRGRRRR